MQTATTLDAPSPGINHPLDAFKAAREEYLERQATFRETIKETERMRAVAAALLVDAEQAVAAWKSMAVLRHVDQAKVSAEMKRAADLQQQAEELIRTADAREELRKVLAVELAKARFYLHDLAGSANANFCAGRLRELLATPGLKDTLSEIYALCRRNFDKATSGEELFLLEQRGSLEAAMQKSFIETLGITRIQGAPVVASVPAPVAGEVTASTNLALARFIKAGGEIPLEAVMPGAIPSKVPHGLKQH